MNTPRSCDPRISRPNPCRKRSTDWGTANSLNGSSNCSARPAPIGSPGARDGGGAVEVAPQAIRAVERREVQALIALADRQPDDLVAPRLERRASQRVARGG